MAHHDVIVIGASSGGVEVLSQLARGLPKGLPAAVFVVCQFPPGSRSVLPDLMSRAGPLLAVHARDGDPVYLGQIYVAPPDHHLILQNGTVRLTHGPRENGHRPAIDPLFRTAARIYGPRVIGVVLSGALYDGVADLLAIRAAGGIAIVQDPQDALVAALPLNATEVAGADHVVPAAALAPLLADLVRRPVTQKGGAPMTDPIDKIPEVQARDQEAQKEGKRRGALSVFTCPECGGSLWQVDEQTVVRFRCHVGHACNGEALLAEQTEIPEAALWTAVRTFKDKTVLARQLAGQERARQRRGRPSLRRTSATGGAVRQQHPSGPPGRDLTRPAGWDDWHASCPWWTVELSQRRSP
jgi:two-component system chemotaxis response regulator CheB